MNKNNSKNIFIKSYGCQMNVYDSNRIKNLFEPKGYSQKQNVEDADIVVLNTCHIRDKGSRKSLFRYWKNSKKEIKIKFRRIQNLLLLVVLLRQKVWKLKNVLL